jgi:hypothetical protein
MLMEKKLLSIYSNQLKPVRQKLFIGNPKESPLKLFFVLNGSNYRSSCGYLIFFFGSFLF